MDFGFSEEQEMFRTAVRDFLKKEFPLKLVHDIEEAGSKELLPIYRKMAELGFLGVTLPEEYGGYGGSWVEVAILNDEAGRALLPTVHVGSITLAGEAILTFGSNEQRRSLLPGLILGERIIAPAWLEAQADPRSPDIDTKVDKRGDHFAINGSKRFVSHTEIATHLLVLARPADKGAGQGDIVLLLVDSNAPGVSQHLLRVQSGEWVADVAFRDVLVDERNYLAGDWSRWLALVDGAKIALAAYSVGAAQAALAMGVDYAKERIQFDRPIGSFQVLQHKLADAAAIIEQAKVMSYYAAWLKEHDGACPEEAAMAKLLAGKALEQAATTASLIHGGYGFSVEHDIQLYFRRIKALEHLPEGAAKQKEIIAEMSGI